MTVWAFLAGVVAPVIFWMAFLRYKDRLQPEPFPLMLTAYGLGIAAGCLVLNGYDLLLAVGLPEGESVLVYGSWPEALAYCVLVIGVPEEAVKFLPFWLICLRFKAFDEEIDGIIYASCVALGFASFENLLLLRQLQGPELYARAFTSPLVHTIFASIWGHACARAHIRGGSLLRAAVIGLILSALVHGLYDFLAIRLEYGLPSALVIMVVWIWRLVVIHRLQQRWQGEQADVPDSQRQKM